MVKALFDEAYDAAILAGDIIGPICSKLSGKDGEFSFW